MNYARDARQVYQDIRRSGGPIVLQQETAVVVDEATDIQTGGVPVEYPHWALILQGGPMPGDTFEAGLRIRTNSRNLIIPAYKLPVIPVVGNIVKFSDDLWEIKSVSPLSPNGGETGKTVGARPQNPTAIMYEVVVTR